MPTVVITGATRGIGRAAAVELARRGAEVAVVGRDADRVRETAEEAGAHGHVAALERMDEVRRLAAELLERYPRIDVLANNAGAMFTSRHVTPDGYEQTFALNLLAPFLLTNLLRERLAESGARVVTTASDAHKGGVLDLDDLQSERGRYRPGRTYATSKLCNVLFTRELQRRTRRSRQLRPPRRDPQRLCQEQRRAGADRRRVGRAVPTLARERRELACVARTRPRRR